MSPDAKPPKLATTEEEEGRANSANLLSGSGSKNDHANNKKPPSSPTASSPSRSPEPAPPPTSAKTNGTMTTTTNTTENGLQKRGQKQQKLGDRRDSGDSDISTESYENYIPSPPDGGWGWVIVVASLFCNMIVDGLGYSFGVFLLEFADYFQESKSKVSLVGSLLCGVYLFAGPVVSGLTNKLGCRPVAVAGSVIASLAFLLSTFAPSVDILILTYGVLGGFGLGMIYLPSIVSVGYYFEKKRALATGIAVCGSGIGTFIFAPLSEYLLEEMDWKNALMIISGITLNGAVCGMLMRPLEPERPKQWPRSKNLLDRIKEQAKGNRNRTWSDNSTNATSVHDTNAAVLKRVMEAKLLREKRLQEDESELGSLPSLFLVRQQSHKDSRVQKLSFSERGGYSSAAASSHYLDSPLGSMPKISSCSLAPTSLSTLVEATQSKPSGGAGTEVVDSSPVAVSAASHSPHPREDPPSRSPSTNAKENSGYETSEVSHSPTTTTEVDRSSGYETTEASRFTEDYRTTLSVSASAGRRNNREKAEEEGRAAQSPNPSSAGGKADEELSASDIFVDADSGTFWDGTNTERSDYDTPLTSPPNTCTPTTPEREGGGEGEGVGKTARGLLDSPKNRMQRTSDPAVAKFLAPSDRGLKNGSVPSNIHRHVHEVVPLLQVPERKTTLVNLGSEKNMWRLKNLQAPVRMCGQSLGSLSVVKKDLARPMYRKDIFYSGSIHHLPLFRSQPDMKSYITSITTIPGETAMVSGREAKVWRCLQCCPQSFRDTIQEMLDLSLLKDRGFLLVCMGNVLAFLGFYVPFVYCMDVAISLEIDRKKAAFLISIIGITNTLGRVGTGWLADLRRIDSLVITYVSIFICGVSTAIFPFCINYGLLCAAASLFGLSVAAFISLSSILICDLLGLEKLTNGFGLLSLFRGMAAMAGPPLAGFVYDQTKSYDASFYLGGALLTAGGLCHLALRLPCVQRQDPTIFIESVSVEELPGPVGSGSGLQPELVTLEEVMTRI